MIKLIHYPLNFVVGYVRKTAAFGKVLSDQIIGIFVRREVGADGISHYCLSNAPLDTPWQELARAQAQRFFIEHSFREAKSECGRPITKSAVGMPGTIIWL
ncbi:MAG: hypothetical protein PHY54_17130 [Methylococcales bacterium]|nr:hypothetical protein [Methylococcales bacterium]